MKRLLVLAAALLAIWLVFRPAEPPPIRATLDVESVLGGPAEEGYARALEPRAFRFPEDHGPHPGFRTEWWYVTGNLEGPAGEEFGYQVTFFRSALTPDPPARASEWAASEAWMAHLAVTGREHRAFERFARGALGLAGAQAEPFRVWLEDWSLQGLDPIRLRAAEEGIALELDLRPTKPPVPQGDRGLSRKGSGRGNASYYYSLTRLETTGRLTLDGSTREVQGLSWLDREWSTSALEEGVEGWDWFSLHLDDGSDLMYYRLRTRKGSASPYSAGSLVRPDGSVLPLDRVGLEPGRRWNGYPVEWRLTAPGLDLRLEALLDEQEMDLSFRYWEGAIRVSGTHTGRGYLEMTGYPGVRRN